MTTTNNAANNNLVVAGAGADGHGVLGGYRGLGALTRALLADYAARAGLPEEWLPAPKDPRTQLARAVTAVARAAGLTVERDDSTAGVLWLLVQGRHDGAYEIGAAYGQVALVVTLGFEGALEIDTDRDDLRQAVQAEYQRRVGAELYQASDVTRWLHEIHRDRLGGVRYGTGWYVPRANRQIAEAITAVLWGDAHWGEGWMDPPLPVATSAQLATGIAKGLIAEVGEVSAELIRVREARQAAGGDIGQRAAEGFVIRFRAVDQRVAAYANLLGPDNVADCRATIADAMIALDSVLEGGVVSALAELMQAA